MDSVIGAASHFEEGFNCSQSVLSAYAEQFGLPSETALRIAAPFGGGMGSMGEVCGAVSGALMVIGLKYGHTKAEDRETKMEAYRLAREFASLFQERNGSIICRELMGCDIGTPEGLQFARDEDLFNTRCLKFVRDATEIVGKMLAEQ